MLQTLKDRLRLSQEPVVYAAVALGMGYVAYEVLVSGASLQDILGDNLGELLLGVLVTALVRLGVYAPATVEALREEKDVQIQLAMERDLDSDNGPVTASVEEDV